MSDQVSCIVVNYFCAPLTLRAARSFFEQCPDGQLLVVDNSTNALEADALRAGLPTGARLIEPGSNTGFATACNLAFEYCDHDFVLLLNPDALLAQHCVKHLLQTMQAQRDLGAVSPLQFWDQAHNWLLPATWRPTGIGMWSLAYALQSSRNAQRLSMAYRALALPLWTPSDLSTVTQRALSGGLLMVRRAAVASVGQLFDPTFFMFYEDSDLCLRLRRKGWRLAIDKRATAVHEWLNADHKEPLMSASHAKYFAMHYHGRGQWEKRIKRLSPDRNLSNPLGAQGLARGTQALDVPGPWQNHWLLEASPSNLMIPALAMPGSGPVLRLDWSLLARLGEHKRLFMRLGPAYRAALNTQVFVVAPKS